MDEIIALINSVGVPIGVMIYLLYERHTIMKEFTEAINSLTALIKEKLK